MATVTELKNPFVGLRAFEEDEDYLFFGRSAEINDLLKKFAGSRFLAVIGSSGSGKSSLVKSGLLPAIYSGFLSVGHNWRVAVMRPGNDPIGNLSKELAKEKVLYENVESSGIPFEPIIESTLRRSGNGLTLVYKEAHLASTENLLIVVDQFEELFRFSKYEKQSNQGVSDSLNFINYFGKKAKHWGISLGMSYSNFVLTDTIESPIVNTYKAFETGNNNDTTYYRRRVTIGSGYEDLTYREFNVPLLFKYRGKFGKKEVKKWSYEISAGPSFTYFNNKSDYNVNMGFEGIYQIDSNPANPADGPFFTYNDNFSAISNWNVWLTADSINNQSNSPGADFAFGELNAHGYDFAYNKNYTGTDKKATRWSVAMNINLDLSYKVNDIMDVKVGGQLLIAPSYKSASHYTPMDKTNDSYNSLYRSNIKSMYISYGLHAGIAIVLDKLDKKLGL